MKNRPLFSICLVLLLGMILAVTAGGGRLIRELSPSPLEQTVSGNDRVLVLGEVYLTEQKAKVQAIYLKNNSIRAKMHRSMKTGFSFIQIPKYKYRLEISYRYPARRIFLTLPGIREILTRNFTISGWISTGLSGRMRLW